MNILRLAPLLLSSILLWGVTPLARADEAASSQSIDQCLTAIKATIQALVFDQDTPVCTMITPDGIAIDSFAIQQPSRPEGLLSSDISEFFRSFVFLWPAEAGTIEAHLQALPTDSVYRVAVSRKDASGTQTSYNDRSVGLGPQYAVLGEEKMYAVRCNAISVDNCVLYTNLFARYSPDGSIVAPDGLPWPPQDRPCYIFLRHSFHELGNGAGLPSVISTTEALARQSADDPDMISTYESFCNGGRIYK